MQQLPDLYPVEGIVDPQPVTPQAPDLPDLFPDGMELIRPDARARQAKLLKPDTAVRDMQLARDAGLAPELVERNRDDITLKADVDRMNAALVGAPGLRAYIHQSPHKMAAVADDVDTLAEIERTVQKGISTLGTTGNAVLRFGPNIEQAASDIIGLVAGTVDSAVRGTAQLTGLQAGGLFGDIRDWALQHSADMQDYKDEYLDNLPPELKGRVIDNPQYLLDPQWLIQNVGDGAASLVPVIVATVLTGGSTLVGGLVGGLMEGASQYRELMEEGVDPDSSALYSQAMVPVVAVLNKLGLDAMLSTRLASTWLQRAGKALAAAGSEGLSEYAEEPFGAFFSSLARGDDYDTTVGNIWKSFENVEALFVGGILGGGVNVMHTAREQAIAQRAEQEQQILDALTQNIMQTKLGQLDPLLLEEAVGAIKAGGQITEIYVPASAVASNFGEDMQGLSETLNQLGVSVDQYGNALTARGDLVIPIEKYAAVVAANPEFAARFANDRRLTPDGLTRNEAVQARADDQAEMARLVEMLKEDREAADEYETEIKGIQDEVLAMRQQTGMAPESVRSDARLTAATFGVLARKSNMSPTELWQAYGPQIQRGGQVAVDQQAMQQDVAYAGVENEAEVEEARRLWAEMGTESPYFKRWFGESKVVDESGKPLVVYHGSAKDFASFDPALAGTMKYSDWGPGIYFTPSEWQADGYSEDARKETDAEANTLWDEYEAKAKEFGTTTMNAAIDLGFGTDKYNELGAYYDKWAKRRKEVAAQPNKTYSVYLSLKNPYIYIASGMTDPSLAERAKSRGHDGIIVRREDGSVDEIVAFNPTQIKSVNNRGTFDPGDPIILNQAQFAGATTLEEIREAKRLWAEMGTESPYFKRWSGGAPVVLKNAAPSFTTGQAVVVEADHGAPDIRFVQEDGVFKSEKERYGFGRSEAAHWFTRDTATAKTYADPRRAFDYQNAEPGVIPAYVRLDNPLVIDAAGQNWRDAQKRGKTSGVIAEARANGHDGVIIYNVKDDYNNDKKTRPTTTLTVFSSTQIKSVNNRGTFDPADARILHQVPPDVARSLNYETKLPQDPIFKEAVANTPGAELLADGVELDLTRYQKEEQTGDTSVRTGVFYLPTGSAQEKHYRGGKNAYGGTVKIQGRTLLRAPLFVKGATGGKAPEAAYDSIVGKKAYSKMRDEVLSAVSGWGLKEQAKVDNIRAILDKYEANTVDAYEIYNNSKQGNTLAYAIQENIVAHAVRKAGYDSVVGYSKKKDGGAFISEVFDVREMTNPDRSGYSDINDVFYQSLSPEAQAMADRIAQALNQPVGPEPDAEVAVSPTLYQVQNLPEWKVKTRTWMEKNGYMAKEIEKHLGAIEGQMRIFAALGPMELEMLPKGAGLNPRARVKGVQTEGPIRSNTDPIYKITFDASAMCVKRLEAAATANYVQAQIGRALTTSERMALVALFRSAGKAAPCIYCYVEAPRAKSGEFVKTATDVVFGVQETPKHTSGKKKGQEKWAESTLAEAMAAKEEARALGLSPTDVDPNVLLDPEYAQTEEAKAKVAAAPAIYKFLRSQQLNAKSNLPKLYEEYDGQILGLPQALLDELNGYAGLRFFSSSDFQAEHVADLMQAVFDMEIRQAKAHAYTKVPDFVRIFGGTGIKIQTSVFAKEENGEIVMDDWQGMNWDEAKAFRAQYDNVGTVLVATSDAIVLWAKQQDWIDYIIPFHFSGLEKKFYTAQNWQDFSSTQTEQPLVEGATIKKIRMHETGSAAGISNEQGTRNYLTLAMERGIVPVFPAFLFKDFQPSGDRAADAKNAKARWELMAKSGEIDWDMIDPEYYKLRKDYARTDTPFSPVQSNIDVAMAEKILGTFLDGTAPKAKVDTAIADRLIGMIRESETTGADIGVEALKRVKEGQTLFQQVMPVDNTTSGGILKEKGEVYGSSDGGAGSVSAGGGEGVYSEERGMRALPGARLVELRPTEKRSVPARVSGPQQAAAAMSFLSDLPQEQLSALVLDEKGRPLAVLSHSLGTTDSSQVDHKALLGAVQDIEGAKSFYLAHNHPAGNAQLSANDRKLSEDIRTINEGSGLSYGGLFAVTPDRYADEYVGGQGYPQPGKQKKVAVVQRFFSKVERVIGFGPISNPNDIIKNMDAITGGVDSGIILLTNNNVPVGFLPISPSEMAKLRGDRLGDVLKSIHRVNATGLIGVLPNESSLPDWRNTAAMANAVYARPLDALYRNGAGAFESAAMQGKDVSSWGNKVFYQKQSPRLDFISNPNVAGGPNETLDVFTEEPGSDQAVARFGKEKVGKKYKDNIFRLDGEFGSWRYIKRGEASGRIIAVAQGVSGRGMDVLSTAYVAPEHRRKGVMSALVNLAKKEKPGLQASGDMSSDGAAFMGYSPQRYQNQAEPQAAFTFKTASGRPLIELFQKANQSSFLHETGHLYLEMIRDLAIKADAPQAMRDLWTQAKTALKIDDGAISREAHEEWSRNLEAYFAKGEAPAVGLRGLFAKYADWLKSIYREVENIFAASGTQFNPELKPIFDRLFATEQEIREAEAFYAAQRPFFDLADQMSDEDRAALQKLREKAQETSFDARLRKLTEAYVKTQGGRKALADELRPEVEGRPVYLAIEAARAGGFELAEIDGLVGEETRKAISKKWKLVKVGGDLDPNVVAAQNGYNSAREMLMEMAAAPNKQEALKAAIDERVEAERQKILRGLMDADAVVAADEAYHNEDRLALLVAEFAVLAEQSSRRQGARARALDAAAAREVARQTMKELPLREAMNYQKFARAERKAAMQARDAKRAGKTAEALQAKRVELLNHALFMESMALRGQIQKLEKAIKKGAKQKSMLPAAKDLLQGLGIQYGIMPYAKLKKGMAWAAYTQSFAAKGEERPTLADWAAEREDEFGVYFDAFVLQNAGYVPLQDLTVEQFDAVRQAVNTIRTVDRNERTVLINGERIAMEEAEDRLEQSILGRKLNSTQRSKRKSELRKTKARLHAFHAKMEAMLLDLDNWSHGHWWNMFFKPIADAENARSERLKEVAAEIQTLFKPVKKGMGKRIFIREINDSLRKSEILAIALNMGNEGNILRLRQGFQDWNMDALFQRMTQTEDLLTARDWKFVQDVWDYLDTFRPESFKLQKDLTGREPERIPPTPLDTMHGVLKGGYYPAVYDTDLNFTAFSREQKDLDKSLFGGRNYGAAMTKHSHLKERAQTGANQALSLELSVITDHVYNTVHDLTHRRAVVEVAKIMKRPKVRKMVEDALSPEAYREFMPWLQDIARERQEPMNQLHRAARWARKGTTIMQMGLKITTMITQPLGILQTPDVIGLKWTAVGLAHVYGNTHKIHRVYDEITTKSLFMAHRIKSFDREVRDAMKGLTTADSFRRQVDEFAFKGIGFVQLGVDMPTWWGAYQKGLAENLGDEAKAVAYADSAVRISQGSGSTKDLARVQRGSEFQKLATMFYSYFSALYSLTYRRAGKTRSLSDIPTAAGSALVLWFLPAILSELIAGRGPDDDEDEFTWAAKLIGVYPFLMLVGIKDIASAIESGFDYQVTPAASAPGAMVKWARSVYKAVEEEDPERAVKPTVEAVGYALQLPLKQPVITLGNIWDYMTGEDPEFEVRDLFFTKPKSRRN